MSNSDNTRPADIQKADRSTPLIERHPSGSDPVVLIGGVKRITRSERDLTKIQLRTQNRDAKHRALCTDPEDFDVPPIRADRHTVMVRN